jgi:hypothetical protein
VPASFSGLVGYKSSTGRYPMEGVFPLSRTLDSLGPLAHTVEDCVLVDAACGESCFPRRLAVSDLRFLLPYTLVLDDCEPAVRANFEASIDRLAQAPPSSGTRCKLSQRSRNSSQSKGTYSGPRLCMCIKSAFAVQTPRHGPSGGQAPADGGKDDRGHPSPSASPVSRRSGLPGTSPNTVFANDRSGKHLPARCPSARRHGAGYNRNPNS